MLLDLFTWLTKTLYGAPVFALLASFVWGVLSILLSPCHLASIPLIIGFVNGQGRVSKARAFTLSLLFSTGILITIALIGVVTGMMGRMLGDIGPWSKYLVAGVLVVVGLHLLDVIPLPLPGSSGQPSFRKKGVLAAFMLGLVFGLALGPCSFAYMAPMLGVAFSVATTHLVFSISLVFAYALGHISILVLAGTFTTAVQSYLDWNENSQGIRIIKKACGIILILAGVYLIQT
jgi:cytochrome c-type biogenesis protein